MLDRETRKLIMKIVGNAKNEILGEIHKISDRQLRTIVKTIRTCTTSEEDQNGPLNQVRRDQVNAVRRILFDAYQHKRPLTLSQACLEAWTDLKGGYPTPKALYNYCNEHKNLF